jgi:hypothetical protein
VRERVSSGRLGVGCAMALAAMTFACRSAKAAEPVAKTTLPAGSSSVVAPQPETELVPRVLPTERIFYGWEIIASGEAGGVLAAASIVLPSAEIGSPLATFGFIIGMPVYALAGPIVHWTHGEFEKGLVSFGANAGGVAIAGLIGGGLRCRASDAPADCGTRGFFDGLAVAVVTVPLIDAIVLGWQDVPISESFTSRKASPALALQPLFSAGPRSATVGVAGSF